MGAVMTTQAQFREQLLTLITALVQANKEDEITAALSLFTDEDAAIRLLYLDLDEQGIPSSVRAVASRKAGEIWHDDPQLGERYPVQLCPLVKRMQAYPDPIWFAEDVSQEGDFNTCPYLSGVVSAIAIKLYGAAHVEQSAQWHSILVISWSETHAFEPVERYIYPALWDTLSVVVSNHRLRWNALENLKRLQELDKLKSDFLHTVSHELRNPLSSLTTLLEGVLVGVDGEINDDVRSDLEFMQHDSKNLLALINDLLDMAQIEAGRVSLKRRNTDISAVIADSVRVIQPMADEKGLDIEQSVAVGLPSIPVDPDRVRQVLVNLLSNAVKFSEQGTITIIAEQNDGNIIIAVQDQGIGIAREDLSAIFSQFYRTEQGSRLAGGSGLGLPISKRLVELHGGEIWVMSTLNEGSTFYVSLPMNGG
jgi:signal transduction histidine kinase